MAKYNWKNRKEKKKSGPPYAWSKSYTLAREEFAIAEPLSYSMGSVVSHDAYQLPVATVGERQLYLTRPDSGEFVLTRDEDTVTISYVNSQSTT